MKIDPESNEAEQNEKEPDVDSRQTQRNAESADA
jgi:hypothetical protein